MTRRRPRDASDAFDPEVHLAEGLDPDGPSPEDLERFGSEFKPCPRCDAAVYDQAEWCHRCGAIMDAPAEAPRPPLWVLFLIGAVLLAFLGFIFRI